MLIEEAGKKHSDASQGVEGRDIPAAITDTGCERELNEDRYAVIESPSGLAWIVCDGMGGSAGGELAAQLAIDAIRRDLENLPPRPVDVALRSAIVEANRIIVLRRQNQAFAGMGTTIVAALFSGPELVIAHVGDSRAYLVRDGAIQQLTVDHTYVQQLVDSGQIQSDEALSHPDAHILTRCIGSEPGLEVEIGKYWIWESQDGELDDFLLLCSDGLYSLVTEGEIANLLAQESPQRTCARLVEMAKERGGYDNITVAIVPLGGQLRQQKPPGFVERKPAPMPAHHAGMQGGAEGPSALRVIGIVFVLSALAALLTIIGMVFVIVK
jgi:protein phosphatase